MLQTLFRNSLSLKTINLNFNWLSLVNDKLFSGLAKLKVLGLVRNYLTTLPSEVFKGLVNLTEIL